MVRFLLAMLFGPLYCLVFGVVWFGYVGFGWVLLFACDCVLRI